MKNYQLILGDCLEVFKSIESGSIDCIITDPPYHITNKNSITFVGGKTVSVKERWGHWEKDTFEEYEQMISGVLTESYRILKPNKCLLMWLRAEYGGYFAVMGERIGFKPFSSLIWKKTNPVPHIRKTNYRSSFEYCIVLCKGERSVPFNFLSQPKMRNVYDLPIGIKDTEHPTEKPLELFKWHILIHTNENDTILDCFTGSGTTGVAALQLNRNFIGIELDPTYYAIAEKRIKAEANQMKLFE